ncbi:aminoglycoside phosphotransferase family protein [Microbacterium sp. NEAU-LLC]|uniref:Aminoglycoside phosphotransferase family protein n=1 Tax=Microbacterium helvum TaxID=2773713 RepID=A0ABR8NP33_9MICO|nr:aminoglycoside phosphotransferase family protein [Microbacterium helvum]MBD3942400.1 aminoglycoside phosphotransferase family protein [Microbacterium helvum]
MATEPGLSVRLVLVLPGGTPLGVTAPFTVAPDPGSEPEWDWREVPAVLGAAGATLGITPTLLRLARVTPREGDRAEEVVYVAEVSERPDLPLYDGEASLIADAPLRMAWAKPGGPDGYLLWAQAALAAQGIAVTGEPEQIRTWNLSALWRLAADSGIVWLKAVPPFFSHEGAVLERLQAYAVPRLLARADDAVLLADVPGDDRYGAGPDTARRMIDLLVGIQSSVDPATLPPMPRWTPTSLAPMAERTLALADDVDADDRTAVASLIARLPRLEADLAMCGLPDTLVHGDFHPGNLRGDDDHLVLLDWGDSGIGHPLLDHAAFMERMPAAAASRLTTHWTSAWRTAVPGSDPARALELLAPYGALRQATLYRGFLDRIEASEQIYHAADPASWLRRTAALERG